MTNQSAKEKVREILEHVIFVCEANRDASPETWNKYILGELKPQALSQIEEIVLGVIGQENEHYKDMPVPDPDPFALPSDHQNQLRRYQLKRWSDK